MANIKDVEKSMNNEPIQHLVSNGAGSAKPMSRQDVLLSDMELPLSETFYPLGYAVQILTNEQSVLDAARESFGHMLPRYTEFTLQVRVGVSDGGTMDCPPEPIRREYNHLFSLVADAENQALMDLKSCTNFIWVKRSTVQRRLYFRYNLLEKPVYVLLGSSVVTDLHAACVSKYDRGVLLCGNSGAGKTTLAYACARAGWTYTSDDTSYLINSSKSPRVAGHSHRIRFRDAAKSVFRELANRELTPRLEGKPSIEVSTSEFDGIETSCEARIHAIVYLNRDFTGTARSVALADGTAVRRMSQELYSSGEIRMKQEKALDALRDIPTYELRYCDLSSAIEILELLVRQN